MFDEALTNTVPVMLMVEEIVHELDTVGHPWIPVFGNILIMLEVTCGNLHLLDLRVNIVVPLCCQVIHLQLSKQLIVP